MTYRSGYVRSIALSVDGHVVAAGDEGVGRGPAGSQDLFVAKYDAMDGRLQWNVYHDYGDYYEEYLEDIVVDGAGNVYVTGRSEKERDALAIALKLNSSGTLLWRYARDDSNGRGVAVDGDGYVYVVGDGIGGTFVVKLAPDGPLVWERTLAGYTGVDIAVRGQGNDARVYVLGRSSAGWSVFRFDGTGNQQPNPPVYAEGTPNPAKLLLDEAGNPYVVGYASDSSTRRVVVVKYADDNQQTVQVWRTFVGNSYRLGGFRRPVDVDATICGGKLYVACVFTRGVKENIDADVGFASLDTNTGSVLWQVRYGEYEEDAVGRRLYYNEVASKITADSQGNVYVGGCSFTDTDGGPGTGNLIVVRGVPAGLLASVDLDGYGGDQGAVWEDVQARSIRPIEDRTAQILVRTGPKALLHQGDGSLPPFMMPDTGWDMYDVSSKPYRPPCPPGGDDISHWLRVATFGGNPMEEGNLVVAIQCLNGDIDGDGEITLFDYGRLVAAFGSLCGESSWDPAADLDGDGEITLYDFSILVRNFGAVGESNWWD